MKAMAFMGCMDSGHGCFPPRPNTQGSATVTVNNIPVHCVSHAWPPHRCGKQVHDGVLSSGADDVTVEGLPVGHIGASVSCGSVVAQGSPDVFVG